MIVLKSSYLLKHEMLDQGRKVFFLMLSVPNHFLHSITSHHACPRTSRLVAVFTYRTAANRFYRVTKTNNKKRRLHRCWKRRIGVGLESVMPVPICSWGFVRFCWGTATCYDGYLWGAKHKSFPSERGGRLVKNETPGKQWWEKKRKKNEAERNDTLYGYLVKNTNIETLNRTPWEYISLLKKVLFEKIHQNNWIWESS